MVLVKRSSTGVYNTVSPAHYQVAFDGNAKDTGWFTFETKLSSQVVAWLYVPKEVHITSARMKELINLGEMLL